MNAPVTDEQCSATGARLELLMEVARSAELSAVVCFDGSFEVAPIPDEILARTSPSLRELQVVDQAIEMIDVANHVDLVRAYETAKRTGMSGCRVRRSLTARQSPGQETSLRLFDLNDVYGVLLVLVGEFAEEWVDLLNVRNVDLRPRMLAHQSSPTGHYEIIDPRTPEVLGWEPGEMVGRSGLSFVHPDDHHTAMTGWMRVLAGEDGSRQRCRFRTKAGDWLWMEVTYSNRLGADGSGRIRVEQLNIEEEMDALAQARAVASQFETLAESLPVGVVHLDALGNVVYANDWVRSLTGATAAADAAIELIDAVHPSDRTDLAKAIDRCLRGHDVDFDLRVLTRGDEPTRLCRVRARPLIVDQLQAGVIASVEDVTESVSLAERLRIQAATDPLTGLPNRAELTEQLQRAIEGCADRDGRFACLFIDLDDFKLVNDGLGHRAGDDALIAIAQRLKASVRPSDVLARVGGDEFIVLCPWASRAEDVIGLAERVMSAVQEPLDLEGTAATVTASVGIALYDGSDDKADVLLSNADMAMYEAKRAGGGQWAIFGDRLRETLEKRLDLHHAVEQAIRNDEFRLHLQPVVELASGQVLGAEALLRWHHPTKGLTMPGDFIDLLAGSDLMRRLGWWIIDDACRIARAAVAQGSPDFEIGVNVTGYQLAEPGFAEKFLDTVAAHDLKTHNVVIEITETTLIEDGPLVSSALDALTQEGTSVALDDFGTGYSSLNHIRDMPVQTLKIDVTYTRRILSCAFTSAIVEAIRDLANKLGLKIVVEGVETDEQRQVLLDMGIEHAQGYLIARPCEEATFLAKHLAP